MNLHLKYIVSKETGRKDVNDLRRKPNSVIASYYGDDGFEYRKRFLSYGEPIVPELGTHKELNLLGKQY